MPTALPQAPGNGSVTGPHSSVVLSLSFYQVFLLLLLYHPCPQLTPAQRGNRAEQQDVVQG